MPGRRWQQDPKGQCLGEITTVTRTVNQQGEGSVSTWGKKTKRTTNWGKRSKWQILLKRQRVKKPMLEGGKKFAYPSLEKIKQKRTEGSQ